MKILSSLLSVLAVAYFTKSEGHLIDDIKIEANSSDFFNWIKEIQESLHEIPELSYEEKLTSEFIQKELTKLDIKFTTGWGKNIYGPPSGGHGIVAEIGTGQSPCIGFRADIDALPLQEIADVKRKSKHDGKMHACGHDSHMSMLLGAAKLLKKHEKHINGTIRLLFQPAEENGAGAYMMIKEGVIEKEPKMEAIFGFHQAPTIPLNTMASNGDAIMGAADFFFGELECKGGHAALPHLSVNPLLYLSYLIQQSQAIIPTEIDTLSPAVLSFTKVTAGTAANIIPEKVEFAGTFRALDLQVMNTIRTRLTELTETIHGGKCKSKIRFLNVPYVPLKNNSLLWKQYKEDMQPYFIDKKAPLFKTDLIDVSPQMPAEDFAFFSQRIPSLFVFLGTGGEDTSHALHSPKFKLNQNVLPKGAFTFCVIAFKQLERLINKQMGQHRDEL